MLSLQWEEINEINMFLFNNKSRATIKFMTYFTVVWGGKLLMIDNKVMLIMGPYEN